MQAAQVIALLLPDSASEPWTGPSSLMSGATALVRDAEGRMKLEEVTADDAYSEQLLNTGCFRRGKPIIDPVSRQVMGYELEMISEPAFLKRANAVAV